MAIEEKGREKVPLPITQFGNPVLRLRAAEVSRSDIGSREIEGIIENMVAALQAAGGIGLAAPQISVSQRIVIIKIRAMTRVGYGDVQETPLMVLINPFLVSASTETRRAPEACLSIRTPDGKGVYEGVVERPESVVITGYGRTGEKISVDASSLLSRALQHELDHLDGILFTDHIKELKDLRVYYPVTSSDPVLSLNQLVGPAL